MAQWTYSRNVQLINEICTVGFLNIDFERCFVSLDVVRISSANGRAIPINLHLHPDTSVRRRRRFSTRSMPGTGLK